jgi:hypothetical protein
VLNKIFCVFVQGHVVTKCSTSCNVLKLYIPATGCIYKFFYLSQNKQRLFSPYTANCFVTKKQNNFTARFELKLKTRLRLMSSLGDVSWSVSNKTCNVRNIKARSRNHFCRGKALNIKGYNCVSLALAVKHKKWMCHILICCLSGSTWMLISP